jgi:hypothetical protein
MNRLEINVRSIMRNFKTFTSKGGGVQMYKYQLEPAKAILESIRLNQGLDFVIIMPRQAGKDELLAHLKIFLLRTLSYRDRNMVEVNPTYKPQTIGAILRLENRMDANLTTRRRWKKRSDYIRMIGTCRVFFLSGDGKANVVGATANLLLIVNEAQDILPAIYEKKFAPMAASRNATRVFVGTAWTSSTLLAEMKHACEEEEKKDGIRRVFFYTAEEVRKENKNYGKFVDGQVKRLGRNHPFIKTQFFCEEIDAQAGMFPPGRQALMKGEHAARTEPEPGKTYAFLIDVAGQDESSIDTNIEEAGHDSPLPPEFRGWQNPGRDSTALKIVEVDMSSVPSLGKPTYKVVLRRLWTGEKHVSVFGALRGLGQTWRPMRMVIDATGVGEGLWSLLDNAFGPDIVVPVKFTQQIKSQLGYGLLGIIECGRYREYHPFDETLRMQLDKCRSEIVPGPAKLMRWGVPDGTRDATSGESVHDYDLITAALCTILDGLKWTYHFKPFIIPGRDPLDDMDKNY